MRALDALEQGIGIKSGSDGSVDAFLAKQLININILHACDGGSWSDRRTIQASRKETQASELGLKPSSLRNKSSRYTDPERVTGDQQIGWMACAVYRCG